MPDNESEVWNAISAFEQILEAMPNDRTSLETLSHAYSQIGDLVKAKEYAVRLAEVIIAEADRDAVAGITATLKKYEDSDPAVTGVITRLQSLSDSAAKSSPAPASGRAESAKESKQSRVDAAVASGVQVTFNIANELPFAWNLLQANEISQEEYSSVVQDLTDMSGTDALVTVSVLHVLNDRGFKTLGKVMTNVAKDCGTPIVALSSFDIQQDSWSILPIEFMIRRGALIFEQFGKDALAVVMNPYDKQLMKDVEMLAGRKCYFYMTAPGEFDATLNKIKGILEVSEGGKK